MSLEKSMESGGRFGGVYIQDASKSVHDDCRVETPGSSDDTTVESAPTYSCQNLLPTLLATGRSSPGLVKHHHPAPLHSTSGEGPWVRQRRASRQFTVARPLAHVMVSSLKPPQCPKLGPSRAINHRPARPIALVSRHQPAIPSGVFSWALLIVSPSSLTRPQRATTKSSKTGPDAPAETLFTACDPSFQEPIVIARIGCRLLERTRGSVAAPICGTDTQAHRQFLTPGRRRSRLFGWL